MPDIGPLGMPVGVQGQDGANGGDYEVLKLQLVRGAGGTQGPWAAWAPGCGWFCQFM